MILGAWAIRWGVPLQAIKELEQFLGLDGPGEPPAKGTSEAAAQAAVRIEAANKGLRMWRNNVGALVDERGVPVRYGLANDSKKMNELLKSHDLVGIRPIPITQAHVGLILGQFVSREIKEPGWRYTGTEREQAQQRWAILINSLGGDASFATGPGTL